MKFEIRSFAIIGLGIMIIILGLVKILFDKTEAIIYFIFGTLTLIVGIINKLKK